MKTRNRNRSNNLTINHNPNIGDTNMRTHNLFSRIGLAMVAILLLSSMQRVYAYGTLAGTTITNQASVQYNAGSNVRNATSNTVSMTVGYKVSINVVANSSSTTTVDSTILYKPFYVSNNGNYTDQFQFTVAGVPAGWVATLYRDYNNGVFVNTDSAITFGTGGVAVDTTIADRLPLILKIAIPLGAQAADNMSAAIVVTTQSFGTGPGGVVRVGGAGAQTYTANVLIAKPVITVTGAQAPSSPSAAQLIPGSSFTYTLSLQNTGHLAIQDGAILTFKLDNNFNFTSATNSGGNSGVDGNGNGGIVSWTVNASDLPASMGSPNTRAVTVTIQEVTSNGTGSAAGSTIYIMDSTHATTTHLIYNDGLHGYSVGTSPLTALTVSQASGAFLAAITGPQSGNPGDLITYMFSIRNGGNSAMTFTLHQTYVSGLDTVHLFTTAVGVAGSQPFTTASIAAGDSLHLYAQLHINQQGQNGDVIVHQLSASPNTAGTNPNGAGNYNPNFNVTTTVTAPSLVINLTTAFISGVGDTVNPAPGAVIEYTLTITNSGSGAATSVTTSNAIPTHTTFLPNAYGASTGIQVGGVAKTNAADADGASCDGNTVTVGPFSLSGSGGQLVIKYQVSVN